jgi:hypothetical protein
MPLGAFVKFVQSIAEQGTLVNSRLCRPRAWNWENTSDELDERIGLVGASRDSCVSKTEWHADQR